MRITTRTIQPHSTRILVGTPETTKVQPPVQVKASPYGVVKIHELNIEV